MVLAMSASPRWLAALSAIALLAALLAALAVLAAGPGYRLAWWPLGPAIQTVRWAAIGGAAAAAVGVVAGTLAFFMKTNRPLRAAALATAIGICVALPPLLHYERAQRLPRIHDISTDLNDPPAFVAVLPLRSASQATNPVSYAAETAVAQKRGYPEIAPKLLPLPTAEAFKKAERAARAMGWEIVDVAPSDLRIEATDTSLLFGFKDDIVIRVSTQENGNPGSRVDVRSLSRVGGSDFGVNAKRVRAYLKKLSSA